ncbi:type VI secretion system membrane subunit TssM [Azospirillum sp. ST 5-10]|uniref:type VI secretion system membrane subunit TssM n=1 Tax=unclassified Azospirillum TaxID=2630922 RepID=UPI003F4A6F46
MTRKRWILEGLLVALIAAAIWLAGPMLRWDESHPLVAPAVRQALVGAVVGLWVATLAVRRLMRSIKARRANRRMLNELARNEELLSLASIGSNEEVSELAERFTQALALLSSRAGGRRMSVYEMPWYVVIGPPGTGKSTLVRNSGLRFPLAKEMGVVALEGVGGTRNCDWWFTDGAVLLDTAGRYTTHESNESLDRAAWGGFLDLLKQHRPRRPINGVVVALSLADLLTQTPEQRAFHGRTVRARINELTQRFGIAIPVYVMFTKADMIAGFTEFFDDMPQAEREQVFGTTFPLQTEGSGTALLLDAREQFDALVQRLNASLLRRLDEERDPARRALIFSFPQTFALLREPLIDTLSEIARPSRYDAACILRGVYFNSATQEGTPIDGIARLSGPSFGLNRTLPAAAGEPRTFFIKRLLSDVVFREADLATVDQKLERNLMLRQWGGVAAGVACVLAAASLWSVSYATNRADLDTIEAEVGQFNAAMPPPTERAAGALAPALQALDRADDVYGTDYSIVPLLSSFGLYRGLSVAPAFDDARLRLLQSQLLPRITERIGNQVAESGGNLDRLKQALEIYLMLGSPDKLDPDRLRGWIVSDWEQTYGYDPQRLATLTKALDDLLANAPMPPQRIDPGLVARARGALNRITVPEQIYAQLKAEAANAALPPFDLIASLGQGGQHSFWPLHGSADRLTIPGLYTRRGLTQFFAPRLPALMGILSEDEWVLGQSAAANPEQLKEVTQQVVTLYVRDYIAHWEGMTKALDVAVFDDFETAADLLGTFGGSASPLVTVLQAINENTDLDSPFAVPAAATATAAAGGAGASSGAAAAPAPGGASGALGRLVGAAASAAAKAEPQLLPEWPGTAIRRHFATLNTLTAASASASPPVNGMVADIGAVYGLVVQIQSSSSPSTAALQYVTRQVGNDDALAAPTGLGAARPVTLVRSLGSDPIASLRKTAALAPQPVRMWLDNLASNTWEVMMREALSEVDTLYGQTVRASCQQTIAGRYPFMRTASDEVTPEDFGAFFKPGGTIDSFFGQVLAPFVNTKTSPWTVARAGGQNLAIDPGALRAFQSAAQIRDLYFRMGQATPGVEFSLNPVFLDAEVTEFTLEYGNTRIVNRHDPQRSRKLAWPATDGSNSVKISFVTADGRRVSQATEGRWAWFRMLDGHAVTPAPSGNRFRIAFQIDGLKAVYDMTAASAVNPFLFDGLRGFACPNAL